MKKYLIIFLVFTSFNCLSYDQTIKRRSKNEHLLYAAKASDFNKVKDLVAKGANVNYKVRWLDHDATPLTEAIESNNSEIIKFLIDKGADIDKESDSLFILHDAVWKGNLDIVKYLLEKGSYLNKSCSNDLIMASVNHNDVLQYLINIGVCVTTKDDDGNTPMFRAVELQRLNNMELLYKYGVKVDSANYNGMTPLHIASMIGNYKISKWLIKNGASINTKDQNNDTPLHYAVKKNKLNIISLLINNKADINIVNKYGERPIDIAVSENYSEAVKLLKNK